MRTIRFRVTLIATIAVALVLTAAAVFLVVRQQSVLTATMDRGLTQRADDIEAAISESGSPQGFAPVGEEGFVELLGSDSKVVATTPNLVGRPPLDLPSDPGTDTIGTVTGLSVDDDSFRFISRSLAGGLHLYVGTTYDVVGESAAALAGSLAMVVPLVVALVGALVWWLVGRTLRPVEEIRSEVASIGSEHLDRRVSAPATGDEIDRLAITMNQMLERIQSSVAREQRFVADASHELRIPLTRLRSEIEVMKAGRAKSLAGRSLESVLDEVIAMQALVEDLLYLARLDASVEVELSPVDLDDVVLEGVHSVGGRDGIDVQLGDVSAVLVLANRNQLSRALANILYNAHRHALTRVDVSLREAGREAIISVRDDGPGVPVEASEGIFDRFARVDEARSTDTGGTGLGLAIARDIVERNGGRLALVNPGERGALFEIHLPVDT
ncbi:MAG: HAMP domain-containing sensor histidine kinase [Acidimicrobiia bacterium]